ncbi:MAG: cytochrome c3 family protein [Gemmataceae bacterium]
MGQIFHRSFNTISKASVFGAVFILAAVGWAMTVVYRSSYVTASETAYVQPVPFSHQHHVAQLGIDCRYCHTSVETSSFAGIPPTKTCMNCHEQIWVGSEMLAQVRESYRSGVSIPWQRVHNLPGFVYFNHSVHIHKGIGCVSCHGRVDEMPLTWQTQSLLMDWCLDCHRAPEQHVRPRDQVFSMTWTLDKEKDASGQPYTQETLGRELVDKYHIQRLESCSTCHR